MNAKTLSLGLLALIMTACGAGGAGTAFDVATPEAKDAFHADMMPALKEYRTAQLQTLGQVGQDDAVTSEQINTLTADFTAAAQDMAAQQGLMVDAATFMTTLEDYAQAQYETPGADTTPFNDLAQAEQEAILKPQVQMAVAMLGHMTEYFEKNGLEALTSGAEPQPSDVLPAAMADLVERLGDDEARVESFFFGPWADTVDFSDVDMNAVVEGSEELQKAQEDMTAIMQGLMVQAMQQAVESEGGADAGTLDALVEAVQDEAAVTIDAAPPEAQVETVVETPTEAVTVE